MSAHGTSHHHVHNETLPRGALLGLGGLVLFTVLLVAGARLAGFEPGAGERAPVTMSRELGFEDLAGGRVRIYDWQSGTLILTLEPGTENFIRGVMRGLARERRSAMAGIETPFLLSQHSDGALTIEDQATGRVIELGAFGPTNSAAFARLLSTSDSGP
jgi:putative photosynthetic complex assembly protein